MPTRVRSFSKINLGLAIGAPRPDGFHDLVTLYQTLALYDMLTVSARRSPKSRIVLTTNDPRVPTDARNTVWKMLALWMAENHEAAEVTVHIDKRLPIQGGMGGGSANAAAALLGLLRELRRDSTAMENAEWGARVGSDVPLFFLGGAVFGSDRGQVVRPAPPVTLAGSARIPCVVALPGIGVSTPLAFRDWDRRLAAQDRPDNDRQSAPDLHSHLKPARLNELSRTYASVFPQAFGQQDDSSRFGASGITSDLGTTGDATHAGYGAQQPISKCHPENLQGAPDEQLHRNSDPDVPRGTKGEDERESEDDLAGNSVLALVRTGIANDFEEVVFAQHPPLREIKRVLTGVPGSPDEAVYSALSGSGSALFGLYRSDRDAGAAQQRLQKHGVKGLMTSTLPRPLYWSEMFAE
jgi:4-diphosphocytidyl-2-C-methyl-D-erythritol kinase